MIRNIVFLFSLVVLASCSNSKKNELLDESIKIHEEVIKKEQSIDQKLKELTSGDLSLSEVTKDSINQIQKDFKDWRESIVEVPGHEHDHHNHEGHHHHDHSSKVDLTPEMVLEIQNELKTNAENIEARIDMVIKELTNEPAEEKE